MHKLSIIIPAYNAEKYLERCLESIVMQTYENIEIVVVNDGSKDQTAAILNVYAQKYPNKVVAIHQENKGVSEARNAGLKKASGTYIGFLDSDDYVKTNMYEKLMEKAIEGDFDIVACDTNAIYPDKTVVIESSIQDHQSVNKLLIDAYTVLWNKVYKKEVLEDISFKPNVWYEDNLYLYQVYTKVKKVGAVHEALHYYVQNEGSITYTYNDKLYNVIENMDEIIRYYKTNGYYETYKEELEYSYVRYLFATFVKRLAKSKDKDKFSDGVNYVIKKVKDAYPNYKKNSYICEKNGKSLYLKHFNPFIAKLIFMMEKNKMN